MRESGDSSEETAKLDFTRALVAALGTAGIEPAAIAVDAEAFTLRFGKVVAQLANVFGEYERTAPADHAALVTAWAQAAAAAAVERPLESGDDAVRALVPVLIPVEEQWLPDYAVPEDPFVTRPFSDDCLFALCLDRPQTIVRLTASRLAQIGIAEDDAWTYAFANLRARSPADAWTVQDGGFFAGAWNDDYDASRAALPETLRSAPVAGRPVVMVPDRNTLFVADEDAPDAVDAMVRAALERYDARERYRSPVPRVLDGDALAPYALRPPLRTEVERRSYAPVGTVYELQRARYAGSTRDGAGLAEYALVTLDATGEVCSVAVWDREPAWLPRTDVVYFGLGQPGAFAVRWSEACAVLGEPEEHPALRPRRYLARSYPAERELKALRARAVDLGTATRAEVVEA